MKQQDPQSYQNYAEQRDRFNERLLQRVRRDLAERRADEAADWDNPDAQRFHAARASLLHYQVNDLTGQASYQQPPQPQPIIVNANPPRKSHPRPPARKRLTPSHQERGTTQA